MLSTMMTRILVVLGGLGLSWIVNAPYLDEVSVAVFQLCLVPLLLLTGLFFTLGLGALKKPPANGAAGRPAPRNVASSPNANRLPPFAARLGLSQGELRAYLRHWRN